MNNEHQRIYDKIERNHKEVLKLVMGIREDIASMKATVETISDMQPEQNQRINGLEKKFWMASGGLTLLFFMLAAKEAGLW